MRYNRLFMTKEMVLAIVIGLTVGLLLTYGFYRARVMVSGPATTSTTQTTNTPLPSPSAVGTLVLISPEDEVVLTEKTLTIAGTTLANAQVVIFVNNEESLTTADSSGNFSTERQLVSGSNVITVHSIDENGNATTVERTVIVANPELLNTQEASPSASPKAR